MHRVRAKVHPSKRAKPQAISLLPHQKKFASKRAFDAGVSLSKYLQILIEADLRDNLLPAAMTSKLVRP